MSEERPPGENWLPWVTFLPWKPGDPQPYDHELVEAWRKGDGNQTSFLKVKDLHPAFNVGDLWWRPA